jgi:hypothetical protein
MSSGTGDFSTLGYKTTVTEVKAPPLIKLEDIKSTITPEVRKKTA